MIAGQLAALTQVVELPPKVICATRRAFEHLTAGALDRPVACSYTGLSRINPNGLPFQWCFCIDGRSPGIRFLCESGVPGSGCRQRLDEAWNTLDEACRSLGLADPSWIRDHVTRWILPPAPDWPSRWGSALWFGVGADRRGVGLKVYVNLDYGSPLERWKRIGRLLLALGRWPWVERLCALSGDVSRASMPSGIAFDIVPADRAARTKVYFHCGGVDRGWLERWYRAVGEVASLPFIHELLNDFPWWPARPYLEKSLFVSLEFSGTRDVCLKTDLAVSRWVSSDTRIVEGIQRFDRFTGLDDRSYVAGLRAIGAWPPDPIHTATHHVVGFGSEPDGSHHVNVYCEPPTSTARGPQANVASLAQQVRP